MTKEEWKILTQIVEACRNANQIKCGSDIRRQTIIAVFDLLKRLKAKEYWALEK